MLHFLISSEKMMKMRDSQARKPGLCRGYAGLILQASGQWFLNGQLGRYDFDDSTGWLSLGDVPVGRFLCKRMQETPLRFPPENHFSKLRGNLGIVSSEIMAEIHKKSRLGFVLVCRGDPWTLRMVGIFWFIQLDAIDAIHRIDASCPQFAV
jgi:hypothetical protein